MRIKISTAVLFGAALCLSCGESRSVEDGTPGPLPLVREPVAPPGTQACSLPAPTLLNPTEGQTVNGQLQIRSPLVEGPCNQSASVVFTVMRFSGEIVHRACSMDVPARTTWNTKKSGDGVYWVMAQRGCNCSTVVCTEYESVRITVDN